MKRQAVCLFVAIVMGGGLGRAAWAAGPKDKGDAKATSGKEADPAGSEPAAPDIGDTTGELDLSDKTDEAAASAVKASSTLTWQDIVVIPRKRFLKGGRLELAPFTGTSINDILIRHYVFGLDLNYFITDALSIGLQGNYYVKQLTERETLIGLQYNRIPTLNRYLWSGLLSFGYVPVYGKFALFNKGIVHWEIIGSAGVGVTKTEIIPRDLALDAFQTMAITPHFGIGGRFFLFDWISVNYMFRDYLILDKFEPLTRTKEVYATAAEAQSHADGKMVNNLMFYVGLGVYFPTSFQYKTPR